MIWYLYFGFGFMVAFIVTYFSRDQKEKDQESISMLVLLALLIMFGWFPIVLIMLRSALKMPSSVEITIKESIQKTVRAVQLKMKQDPW